MKRSMIIFITGNHVFLCCFNKFSGQSGQMNKKSLVAGGGG